jgi:hypothetical protein
MPVRIREQTLDLLPIGPEFLKPPITGPVF